MNFDSGFDRQRATRLASRVYYRRSGEDWRFRLPRDDAPAFLGTAGWTIDALLTAAELHDDFLADTNLPGTPNTSAFAVIAKR